MANIDIINAEIAELEQKTLNYTVAEKLAIMYTLRAQYAPKTETTLVKQPSPTIRYESESEFAKAVQGKPYRAVMSLMDELMCVVQVTNERLYDCVMRKLTGI